MSLESDMQQNIQGKLDFSSSPAGEAHEAGIEEPESLPVVHGPENPAITNGLTEEACERENLKEALRRVKANKGSAGVDGMTVDEITGYLKEYWPAIRKQPLIGQHRRQRSWPLVPRAQQSPKCGAFQRVLQVARSSFVVRGVLA
jgi:RNA-directed DNA polymerase